MNEDSHARVFIFIPSGDKWEAEFGISLSLMFCQITQFKLPKDAWFNEITLSVQNSRGSMLSSLRQMGMAAAVDSGASHILCLDSDMQFPPHALTQLLLHNVDVVGCNYAMKKKESEPTARFLGGRQVQFNAQGDGRGLLRVGHLGMGCVLIRLSCLKELDLPLFYQEWDPMELDFCGEDVYFFRKLQQAGVDVWCDMELSKEVAHMGSYAYGQEDIHIAPPILIRGAS